MRKYFDYKVVHTFILPLEVLRPGIMLLAFPVEDNIVVFELKIQFENENFILSSDCSFV